MRLHPPVKTPLIVSLSALLLCLPGCSRDRSLVNSAVPVLSHINKTLNENCDVHLIQESLPPMIAGVENLLASSPENRTLLLKGAQACFTYAWAFAEEESTLRASRYYNRAKEFAFRALFKKRERKAVARSSNEEFKVRMERCNRKDVPALFWASVAWLRHIRLNRNDILVYLDMPKAEMMALRLVELDESYYFGSPHLILGALYTFWPEPGMGDLRKSRFHFRRAMEISRTRFLMARLLYAEFYTVRTQNRGLFRMTLENIVAAPDNLQPDACMVNELSRIKADRLLKKINVFFPAHGN